MKLIVSILLLIAIVFSYTMYKQKKALEEELIITQASLCMERDYRIKYKALLDSSRQSHKETLKEFNEMIERVKTLEIGESGGVRFNSYGSIERFNSTPYIYKK